MILIWSIRNRVFRISESLCSYTLPSLLFIAFLLIALPASCHGATQAGRSSYGRDYCPVSLRPEISPNSNPSNKHDEDAQGVTLANLLSLEPPEPISRSPSRPSKCLCYKGSSEFSSESVKLHCEGANLAEVFVALLAFKSNRVSDESTPLFDELVVRSAPSLSLIFGPLFHGKVIRSLSVIASNASEIREEVFRDPALIRSLSSLSLAHNSFTSVPKVVVNFPEGNNVTHLSLAHNRITSIAATPFSALANLSTLDLSSNLISSLHSNSFAGLGSLDVLLLDHNRLVKFERNLFRPIAKTLRVLDFAHNSFRELGKQDFNEVTQITSLNMSYNEFSTLPRSALARVSQLMHFNIAGNNFTSLDSFLLRGIRFLRSFNASHNGISELARGALKSITRIKTIDLRHNALEEVPSDVFTQLTWLEQLELGYNRIHRIKSGAFDRLFQFSLGLQDNNLSIIESGAFRSCANITRLDLSFNSIQSVGPLAFGGTDQDVSDVTELDLSFNSFTSLSNFSVLSNFTGLKLLNLSRNSISGHLDRRSAGFMSQKRLYEVHTVDLSFNNISEISGHIFEKFASVRLINLTHNVLVRVGSGSFGNLPTLLTLDLSHNQIGEVSSGCFIHLISLRELLLQDNQITQMFAGVPFSLTDLHLERNLITEIPPGIFPSINSLLRIFMEHNQIGSIAAGAFRNLVSLQVIALSHNKLTHIPREALQDCAFALQNISLAHNQIATLDRQAFGHLPIVFDVQLQYNNIQEVQSLAFDGLLQLLALNVSHNRITKLPTDVFTGLVSLQSLDMSHNELTQLSESTRDRPTSATSTKSPFEPLLSVEFINLAHNRISYMNDYSLPRSPYIPYKLTRVNLLDNPLGAVGVTRYIHKSPRSKIVFSEVDKNEDYTVWLSDTCRCTCPQLSMCITYGKRALQVQPKCLLENCAP